MRAKLIRAMANGKSLTNASKEAGYSCAQAGSNALRIVRETMPGVIDRLGFTDEVLIKEYLSPLMKAEETIYFQNGGIVMDKRVEPALGIRQSSLDMMFRLKNKYPNKLEIEHTGAIVHLMTETEKVEAAQSLKRIAAFEGEESESVIQGEVVHARD